MEQLRVATGGGAKGAVFMCESGGTMKPSVNFPFGKGSRSLQAAYKALKVCACAQRTLMAHALNLVAPPQRSTLCTTQTVKLANFMWGLS